MPHPRARRFALPAVSLLLAAACGGGSPSGPRPVAATPTPAPIPTPVPPPVALEGLTHERMEAEIAPPTPALRDTVSVRAPLCLLREQRYDGGPVYLWQTEEDYVDAVVYGTKFSDGSYRLIRWAGGFTVTLDQDLNLNDTVVRKAQEVLAEVTRRTGMPLALGEGGAVHVTVDPGILDDNLVGQASWRFQGASIVGATVKFARLADITGGIGGGHANTFLHEMGHVMGLGHSPLDREIMTPGDRRLITAGEFQPREALALHMMYQHRAAGNRPPDRDPALAAAAAATPIATTIRD